MPFVKQMMLTMVIILFGYFFVTGEAWRRVSCWYRCSVCNCCWRSIGRTWAWRLNDIWNISHLPSPIHRSDIHHYGVLIASTHKTGVREPFVNRGGGQCQKSSFNM